MAYLVSMEYQPKGKGPRIRADLIVPAPVDSSDEKVLELAETLPLADPKQEWLRNLVIQSDVDVAAMPIFKPVPRKILVRSAYRGDKEIYSTEKE